MKIIELKKINKKELTVMLQEKRQKIQSLRFDFSENKNKNTKELRETRKDIAKILTLLKK